MCGGTSSRRRSRTGEFFVFPDLFFFEAGFFFPREKERKSSPFLLSPFFNFFLSENRDIIPMFAPGRIIFLRPLKSTSSRKKTGKKLTVKSFDAVWITAQELAGEGILVSPAMLTDHLIEATVQEAIAHSIIFHPQNPSDPAELEKQRALAAKMEKLVRVFFFSRSRPSFFPFKKPSKVSSIDFLFPPPTPKKKRRRTRSWSRGPRQRRGRRSTRTSGFEFLFFSKRSLIYRKR